MACVCSELQLHHVGCDCGGETAAEEWKRLASYGWRKIVSNLSVIQYPSGSWGFVGSVPQALAYKSSDPRYLGVARQSGPGFARRIAAREGGSFEPLSWPSKAKALAAAKDAGFKVDGEK